MNKKETNILKGIAIIMMYMHHLFYSSNGLDYPILWGNREMQLVLEISRFGKVCVAVFVFISAYGLTKQYREKQIFENKMVTKDAIIRYKKLLTNFWCIYILFLIVSFFNENHTWWGRYGEDGVLLAIKYFIIDILGMAKLFGTPTFNSTWWYLSLAIVLFVVVPIVNKIYDQIGALCILGALMFSIMVYSPNYIGEYLLRYLPGIALGVVMAREDSFEKWKVLAQKKPSMFSGIAFGLILVLISSVYVRNNGLMAPYSIDNIVVVLLALVVVIIFNWRGTKLFGIILDNLGKHSMNMFLSHTFIKAYFFEDFTYSFRYWWLILLVLIIDTWLVSVVVEFLKKKCRKLKMRY